MIRGNNRPAPESAELSAAQKIDAQLNCDIHNRFDIEVVDAATGEVKQRAQAQNVICNQLWTRLLTPAAYFNYIHYGTGNGTPSATDTSLFAFLGYGTPSTTDDVYSTDNGNGVISLRRKIQLSESTAVGSTLTEVGIGSGTTAATLCTHAMLKDMNGNTISIAKTATDIINIHATVFVNFNTSGYNNNLFIMPPTYPGFYDLPTLMRFLLGMSSSLTNIYALLRPGGYFHVMGTASNWDKNMDLFCKGCLRTTSTVTPEFNSTNKTIKITLPRLNVSSGNVAKGIGSIQLFSNYYLSSSSLYTSGFLACVVGGSWYPGTAVSGEAIGTGNGSAVDFATAFDRVQSGAKIYIDGAEQTNGVTVSTDQPYYYNNMGVYFELLDCSANTILPSPVIGGYIPYPAAGDYATYYNPYYSNGIRSFSKQNVTVEVSNDLANWTDITNDYANLPIEYRSYKYWKLTSTSSNEDAYIYNALSDTYSDINNVHFTTAPPAGAVITADYTTKTIAKDENHVFDLTVTIQLG